MNRTPALPQVTIPAPLGFFCQAGRDPSVTLLGSLQIGLPALNKENPMDTNISNDVLHLGSQSKLSPEEIAKALAHHKRHHSGDQPQKAAAHAAGSKKGKSGK